MSLKLQQRLQKLENWSGGLLGLSAVHLPSKKAIQYNADHQFLLCSTYKIPMAVCLLQKIENNEIDLEKIISIHDYDLRAGMISTLNQLNYALPVNMTIINLLQFMLSESCNTATDIILRLIGGPSAVMQTIKDLGISHLRVDRYTLEILGDWDGTGKFIASDHRCTLDQYKDFEKRISAEELENFHKDFMKDNRDRGTPEAMTQLLLKIVDGSIITPGSAEKLLSIMQRCKTGADRIMGRLPPNTKVSHKTGTLRGYVHDVGVIHGSDKNEKIVLSVFTENHENPQLNERLIAEAARTIYDFFMTMS